MVHVLQLTMLDLNLVATLSILSLLAYLHFKRRYQPSYSRLPLPPGPKPLPILGNIFQMPTRHEPEVYEQWGRAFGSDIIYVNLAGTPMIILNSSKAANDLLERRSSNYSGRPLSIMVSELMGWDWMMAFAPYGERWRALRRLFHREFHPQAAMQFRPLEIEAAHDLLRRFVTSPEDFDEHLHHMAGGVIMDTSYGIKIKPRNDEYIRAAHIANDSLFMAAAPGSFYVDYLPFLKYVPEWMPGAGFKRKAREWRKLQDDVFNLPYEASRKAHMDGGSTPSFVSKCLENIRSDDVTDRDYQEYLIKATAAAMYEAGTDTIVTLVRTFILAMVFNPDVQVKAQKELDDVVGHGHLPGFEHENSLPYVKAVLKELLRWRPSVPQGLPHLVRDEDAYNGYRIPSNTIVIPNIWAMLYNENIYPNPSQFNPERYLTADGQLDATIRNPELAAFGFGRRICPGRYMAMSSSWIIIASILAMFDIGKSVDEDGAYIDPSGEFTPSGTLVSPLPFKASITPRSAATKAAVLATTT
ncbi:hypothetical protein PLICRDRAFT_273725 [Plicaturopsis crispa FD-325 SS-3]|nr:hypothetical protein PLICRDRAFT_273725 [Plicaturopsis crispa FD-325 SS-3]